MRVEITRAQRDGLEMLGHECLDGIAIVKAYDAAHAAMTSAVNAIARARELTSVELEIDDEPAVSAADDGCWVASWTWVSYADLEPST